MPWTVADVDSKVKGLSAKAKRAWVHIANSALKSCKKRGGSECDASAIRQANAAAQRVSESMADLDVLLIISEALHTCDSWDAIRRSVYIALSREYTATDMYPWVRDMWDGWVVYEVGDSCYQRTYSVDADGVATLGEPQEVEQIWMPTAEVHSESGDVKDVNLVEAGLPFREKALAKDGTAAIKIISPGQGSSGYYPKEMLQRDGPKVFKKGTHMFWDHPTVREEADRPEGSLQNLAAELVEDAAWDDSGNDGPGLYSKAKVFERFQGAVNELAPHIGVSIRAGGKYKDAQVGGKPTRIITELTHAASVDFVTRAGAGGKVLQVFEAARNGAQSDPDRNQPTKESLVTDQEAKELRESVNSLATDNRALRESLLRNEVSSFVERKVSAVEGITPAMRERLTERLVAKDVFSQFVESGVLNTVKFAERIKSEANNELAYVKSFSKSGKIDGVGEGDGVGTGTKFTEAMTQAEESLTETVGAFRKQYGGAASGN